MRGEALAFKTLLAYESLAVFTHGVPTVTSIVRRMSWPQRAAVTAALAGWLAVHFDLHRAR